MSNPHTPDPVGLDWQGLPRQIHVYPAKPPGPRIRVVSIDPGEKFVGIALWTRGQVVWAEVMPPDEAVDWVWAHLDGRDFERVVMENWRNFGSQVTWSTCGTVEVIGAVKHKARQCGIPVTLQPSTILRPGRARMSAHGVAFPDLSHIPAKDRNHAESAVIHGAWWHLEQQFPDPGALRLT